MGGLIANRGIYSKCIDFIYIVYKVCSTIKYSKQYIILSSKRTAIKTVIKKFFSKDFMEKSINRNENIC